MASKKKRGRRPPATRRAKAKAGAPKAKAGARKAKAGAPKAKAGAPKAKAGARKAKAGAQRTKAGTKKATGAAARKRPSATVAKGRSRKPTVTKKRMPRAADSAAAKPSTQRRSGPPILDEVLEEPLLDVSAILRVKDGVARSQRDIDEDALKQFPDPSLVVEAATSGGRGDEDHTEDSYTNLPDLFAAEARRQKERAADSPAAATDTRRDGSLFGSLGSGAPKHDVDPEADSDSDAEPDDRDGD